MRILTPKVLGILNITEDSFSDGGLYLKSDKALEKARRLIEDGATIIDRGRFQQSCDQSDSAPSRNRPFKTGD